MYLQRLYTLPGVGESYAHTRICDSRLRTVTRSFYHEFAPLWKHSQDELLTKVKICGIIYENVTTKASLRAHLIQRSGRLIDFVPVRHCIPEQRGVI